MKKLIVILINIICFSILILFTNDYSDLVLTATVIILILFLVFLLVIYKRKYISKSIIILHIVCVIIQCIIINLLEYFNIWKTDNGLMNLGVSSLGMFFYFCLQFFFLLLILIVNCIKYIIIKFKIGRR